MIDELRYHDPSKQQIITKQAARAAYAAAEKAQGLGITAQQLADLAA